MCEFFGTAIETLTEIDADRPPFAARERLEIADCLRANEHAECEFLAGKGNVRARSAGELHEDSVRGTTLVQLPGGVEKARSVTGCRRDVQRSRDRLADLRDQLVAFRSLTEILGERDVIARLDFTQ